MGRGEWGEQGPRSSLPWGPCEDRDKFLGTATDKAEGGRDRRQAGSRLYEVRFGLGSVAYLECTKPRVQAPVPISIVVGTSLECQNLGGKDRMMTSSRSSWGT